MRCGGTWMGMAWSDDEANAERYFAAFPDAAEGMGCAEGCRGYELARDLDFKSAGSYASRGGEREVD